MKKLVLAALATTALTGTALAAEAFVGQVGNGHYGVNIQLNQSDDSDSSAIIYQAATSTTSPNGHDAIQVQLSDDNYAYTYQTSVYHDFTALTWQEGGEDNTGITVQTSAGDTGSTPVPFRSQIVQKGSDNVAVNWQSTETTSLTYTLTAATPQLTLTGVPITLAPENQSINVGPLQFTP